MNKPLIFNDSELAQYNFGAAHPFGPARYHVYADAFNAQHLSADVNIGQSVLATDEEIERFHTKAYILKVKGLSDMGIGYMDGGDTPAFKGVYEASARVVGTSLAAMHAIMTGKTKRAFVPIAGLHHARRDRAAGFCVFNDCGVVIESLRQLYGINSIAYVDIDAHHGDGVFYSFETDADLCFVDIHEDGRFLYPGTGDILETGKDKAKGTKLNIPMPMQASDEVFFKVWQQAEAFLAAAKPEFIILQCGVDSLADDPITHLLYSEAAHTHATTRLCELADQYSDGRILVLGGGGYNLENIARGWSAVVRSLIESVKTLST